MEGVLSIVVLTSVFLLHAGADIPIHPDFNIQQISGKWYPTALAVYNAELRPSDPAYQVVMPAENGDLLVTNTVLRKGKCVTREVPFRHTDVPGKFLSHKRTSILRMVDVNHDSYYILHVEMRYTAAMHLYTRKRTGIDQEKRKFEEVAKSLGFQDYQIHFLNKGDQRTMRVVEIDYSSYCILHFATRDANILHLYSREPQLSDDVREKFINRVTSLEFHEEDIAYKERTEDCPSDSGDSSRNWKMWDLHAF